MFEASGLKLTPKGEDLFFSRNQADLCLGLGPLDIIGHVLITWREGQEVNADDLVGVYLKERHGTVSWELVQGEHYTVDWIAWNGLYIIPHSMKEAVYKTTLATHLTHESLMNLLSWIVTARK